VPVANLNTLIERAENGCTSGQNRSKLASLTAVRCGRGAVRVVGRTTAIAHRDGAAIILLFSETELVRVWTGRSRTEQPLAENKGTSAPDIGSEWTALPNGTRATGGAPLGCNE
jgi:hypothetical protein